MEDKEIVDLYFKRDELAIKATAAKYETYCKAIAKNILDNDEDAKECVNTTYLKVWNSIPPKRPDVLRTFIGKITRNTAFDEYKKRTAEKRGEGQMPVVLDELAECISAGNSLEDELDKKELVKVINEFLGTLDRGKCAIFLRRYWYTESILDIAKRYGVSENYVSVNLNRIRKKLQEFLKKRGFDV